MRHEFDFFELPPAAGRRIAFTWDDDNGEILGGGSGFAMGLIDDAKAEGFVICDDIGGQIPVFDPVKSASEFAAVMGLAALPESLKPFYPTRDYSGFVAFDDDADGTFTPEFNVLF